MGMSKILRTCLVPQCGAPLEAQLSARGLCRPCYMSARFQIKRGNTSWEELESLGLAKPSRRSATGHAVPLINTAIEQARKEKLTNAG